MDRSLFLQELSNTRFEIKDLLAFLKTAYNTKHDIQEIIKDSQFQQQQQMEESDLEIKIIKDLLVYVNKYVHEDKHDSADESKDRLFEIHLFHVDDKKEIEFFGKIKEILPEQINDDQPQKLIDLIPCIIARNVNKDQGTSIKNKIEEAGGGCLLI